jgi:hypothetical protein
MTQKTTIEITCDRCGNAVGPDSTFWRASVQIYQGRNAGFEPDWMPDEDWPNQLDYCSECVQPVFGEVMRKVAKANRKARA